MRRVAAFCAVAALGLFGVGCGAKKDLANTDLAVAKFHAQLDAGSFDQIYTDADQSFRDSISQEKLNTFLGAVHRKLGYTKSSDRKSFFVNLGTSGERITVNYATQFDQDNAQERFVFQVSGADVKLLGYHINSDALVTK
jgi:hypothetical protein